jgi:hypothetical protein
MPSRLIFAALMPRDVVMRARHEFDAVVADGKDDMTAAEVIEAATAHRAEALLFTNTLPLTAEVIAQLPQSVRAAQLAASATTIFTWLPRGSAASW